MDFRKYSYNKSEREEASREPSPYSNPTGDSFSDSTEKFLQNFQLDADFSGEESTVFYSEESRKISDEFSNWFGETNLNDDAKARKKTEDSSEDLNSDLFHMPPRKTSLNTGRPDVYFDINVSEDSEYEKREQEKREERRKRRREERRRRKRRCRIAFGIFALLVLIFVIFVICKIANSGAESESSESATSASDLISSEEPSEKTETETAGTTEPTNVITEAPTETPAAIPYRDATPGVSINPQGPYVVPSWIVQDILTISQYNRPGRALSPVKNIVVHYVGNPGSSAKDNRDYFEDLSNPKVNPTGHGASSHFIVGLHGEIVQCVPLNEVAYANYPRNDDTVSIEVCHPDAEGKFTDTTYWSLIKLISFLCQKLNLTENQVIRHFDVSGKECPVYYVRHPEAFEQMKADVRAYLQAHPDIQSECP